MNSRQIILPKESGGFTAYWVDEGSSITESNFTSTSVTLTAIKLCALTETVSMELIQDGLFDIVSYITEAISYAKAQKLDYETLFGASGTWGANIGLLTAIVTQSRTVGGTPTGGNYFSALTDEDISYAIQYLSAKDSAQGRLVTGKLIQHYIRTLKDNAGQPIFVMPSAPTVPMTVYGYPYECWAQAAVSDAASTAFGVFGDFKQFCIAQRMGEMSLDVDPYHAFEYGSLRYRSMSRWALKPKRVTAFIRLISGT
jgi:HK97 family phage major capsid protein